ncbi:MAG TPA: RDD family protein [Candidatus Methylomirabilis sp.]|nr:RDD family protein [Candidatus Methylomirabilis sp.]
MRCPACGFVGFDHLPACKRCGKELPPSRKGWGVVEATASGVRVVPTDPSTLRIGGFWLRAVAVLVDLALVGTLVAAGGGLVSVAVQVGGWFSSTPELALEWLENSARSCLSALIILSYFTAFVGWRGQTPGKMLFRLSIVRVSGQEVGYGRAFVRWVGQILSALLLGIGFLMIALSRKKQGLHDKLADTYVVRLSP